MNATIGVVGARASAVALATAMQESRLENIDYDDRDSVGPFPQRPSQGWGTVDQVTDRGTRPGSSTSTW